MRHKQHPFRDGLVAGFAWPFIVLGGVVGVVYWLTGMVPFPIRRSAEGEVTVKLVDPVDIPSYWQRWQTELAPLTARISQVMEQVRTARATNWLEHP